MGLIQHAKNELDIIGMTKDCEEMDLSMRDDVLALIGIFAEQGHSGASAGYCLGLLKRLMDYLPLSELTGEDNEWSDVSEYTDGVKRYQNRRCSSVFKDDTGIYNINGIVFWEWYKPDFGVSLKSYFTNINSRVEVKFPYVVPSEPIYKERVKDND